MIVEFLSQFGRDLDNIDDKKIKSKIVDVIEKFESAKILPDIKNIKKLTGYRNAYRFKLGDYRIGFFYANGKVEFARMIHRKDIYKLFP
ncbi:MAG: type II toxin-antitoxin system RelE/ParE family toxin [Bacteroidota bacterium]|jgi:mRNA interferase RelE/StbE